MVDFTVPASFEETAQRLAEGIANSGLSAKLIDRYRIRTPEGRQAEILVFEKYFMRTSNRASLTVTVDNLQNGTRVHAAASGGGKDTLFSFDWGAGGSFEQSVEDSLRGLL